MTTTPKPVERMTQEEINRRLFELVDEYAKRNLTALWQTTDKRPEVLGLMMSSAFDWDGGAIMLAAAEGLEDSNWHAAAAEVRAMV